MNRREMLAGLLSLPFVPKFLRPKKKETACDPCRAHVAVVTENGTMPLTVTEHTPLQTTAECTVPCTITDVIFHVKEMQGSAVVCNSVMLTSVLPEGSRIEVRKGDILVIKITHHHYKHSYSCTRKSRTYYISPCDKPSAVFMLGRDRQTIDDITSNQKLPENKQQKWDGENNILRYYNIQSGHFGHNVWYLAGCHHWRMLNNEKALHLSLGDPLLDGNRGKYAVIQPSRIHGRNHE